MAVSVDAVVAGQPMGIVRYLDVALVAIATVPALALGAPAFGYIVGAAAWIITRAIAYGDRGLINRVADPVRRAGAGVFEAFGRIWLLAAAIILAGVAGGRTDGLAAALTIFAAYSVAFVIRLFSGPPAPRN